MLSKQIKLSIALIPILTVVLLGVHSCKKEEPVPVPNPTINPPSSQLGTMFDNNLQNQTQSFTINASVWNMIEGNQGTRVYIPAGSFQDASGAVVTGTVEVEMVEILSLKDAILTNKPTVSNGQILTTGGELNVNAYQSGERLGLTPGANVSFMVPTAAPDNNMGLFLGTTDAQLDVNWVPSDSLGVADSVNVIGDTTATGGWSDFYYFDITGDSLGWINCDYFYSDPNPKTTLSVLPNGVHDVTNTFVWIYISSANSVAPLWWDATDSFDSYLNSLPIGLDATIVAISEISGDYYSAFVPITISAGHVENITLNATTLAQFETDLDNL